MQFAVLACLLIAATSAFPQDVDVGIFSDQGAFGTLAALTFRYLPSQERVVDLFLQDFLARIRRRIEESGLAPVQVEKYEIDYVFIDGLVELFGQVVNLEVVGLNNIFFNSIYYNILFGRLDWDLVMPEVRISVGKWDVEGRYGDRGGKVKVSGRLVISNSRLRGNALLRLDPGPKVHIYNINVDFGIDNFEADLRVIWQCRGCDKPADLSEDANEFMNEILNNLLSSYKPEIDTIIAEIIRYFVNWYW